MKTRKSEITYCLNIHPGETWEANFNAIKTHALKVKKIVSPNDDFPLGLRLSAVAARQLRRKRALQEFKSFLNDNGMFVPTINGFPYGQFHGQRVKTSVYRPDWRTKKRVEYTLLLADILADLLLPDVKGSISTVPGAYRRWIDTEEKKNAIVQNIAETASHLREIHQTTGKEINLALEPEPDCFLENSDDVITFFRKTLPEKGLPYLKYKLGLSKAKAEAILRRHVGLCFDVAHFQVAFEEPSEALARILETDVNISKIQMSSALCLKPNEKSLAKLATFSDHVYLHQVKVKKKLGAINSFFDLPDALELARRSEQNENDEWRVHFHVPLFIERYEQLWSAVATMDKRFFRQIIEMPESPFMEVETYTFDVLPKNVRPKSIVNSIAREIEWTRGSLRLAQK